MSNELSMTCSGIQKTLKQFLDDRLVEQEYRAFFLHLESCPKCKEYVRSVGSLSNQLWKLGEIDVPSDLSSNIIFELKKTEEGTPQSSLAIFKKIVFGIVILVVGFLLVFLGMKFFKKPQPSFKLDETKILKARDKGEGRFFHINEENVVVKTIKEQKPVDEREAEYLFNQLNAIADSLEPFQEKAIDEKNLKEVISEKKDMSSEKNLIEKKGELFLGESSEIDKTAVMNARSIHWHIPYFKEAEMTQLVDTIRILEIDPEYEDQNFLVFKATSEKLKILSDGVGFTNKLRLDLPDFVTGGFFPKMKIPVSIFFIMQVPFRFEDSISASERTTDALVSLEQKTDLKERALDWHVLLFPSQRDTLLDVIHQGGGKVNYMSKGEIIFSTYGARIKKLAEQIRSTGGIFVDFGKMGLNEDVLMRETVNVLVTITEK